MEPPAPAIEQEEVAILGLASNDLKSGAGERIVPIGSAYPRQSAQGWQDLRIDAMRPCGKANAIKPAFRRRSAQLKAGADGE